MKIIVNHITEYSYSKPVYLENHYVKLKPKSDNTQTIIKYDIDIFPKPFKIASVKDIEDNNTFCLWFEELTNKLTISINFEIDVLRTNPFDFIIESCAVHTPIDYTSTQKALLSSYLVNNNIEKNVIELSKSLLNESNNQTLAFLNATNNWIYKHCNHMIRPHGEPHSSSITLSSLKGSCRDMAVLFMDMCKLAGIASRFVSGYHYVKNNKQENHLHAWVEVYVPGAGWIGYDPSYGLVVSDNYITVATSAFPKFAAPVTGSFRGNDVLSDMKAKVKVTKLLD